MSAISTKRKQIAQNRRHLTFNLYKQQPQPSPYFILKFAVIHLKVHSCSS